MKIVNYTWMSNDVIHFDEEIHSVVFKSDDYSFYDYLTVIRNLEIEQYINTYYVLENGERTGESFLLLNK